MFATQIDKTKQTMAALAAAIFFTAASMSITIDPAVGSPAMQAPAVAHVQAVNA